MAFDPVTGKEIRSVNVSVDDPASAVIAAVPDPTDTERPPGLPAADPADDLTPDSEDDRARVAELRAKPSLFDQERDAIGERHAARRAAQLGLTPEGEPAPATEAEPAAPPPIDPAAPAPPAPRITDSPAPGSATAKTYEVTVNGRTVLMAEADLVKAAEQGLATGITLEEARRLREEAADRAAAARTATPAPADRGEAARTTDQPNDPARPAKKAAVDPARLTSIVERLQVGTPEEGAQALVDLLAEAVPQAPSNDGNVVATAVETVLERRSAAKEAETALVGFKAKYPALADDDDFANMVIKRTSDEIIKDFERIGVPASDIAAARKDPNVLIEGYRNLRTQVNPATGRPWALRNYSEILDAAGTAVAQKVGLQPRTAPGVVEPGKVTVSPNRVAAKANLTQQPRSAGLPAAAGRSGNQSQQPPTRASGSDIVAEQRRARGFV